MAGIDKSFGAIRANRGASLEVMPGEIHALVGENGAGKSTLMRILGGLMRPDAGRVEVNGQDVTGWSTNDAIAAGIGIVHQHFMLVPTLTVAENLVLGYEPKTRGFVLDYKRAADDARKLSNETGLVIAPDRLVSDLSVGEAQRVEILKVLYRGAKILVLDEPTANLAPAIARVVLSEHVRSLALTGASVLIVEQRARAVLEISDRTYVLGGGRVRMKGTPAELTASPEFVDSFLGGGQRAALSAHDEN